MPDPLWIRHFYFPAIGNTMRGFVCILFILFASNVSAQEHHPYRYDKDFIPADFYEKNRSELRAQLPDSSFAVLFSSQVRNRANDTDYPYHQNPQFYYMTGFTEPNSLLLIFKSPYNILGKNTDEVLFVRSRNISKELWTGRISGVEEAKTISGVETVFYSNVFDSVKLNTPDFSKILYLSLPTGLADDRNDNFDLFNLVESFKSKISFPPANGDSYLLNNILKRMREVKKEEEIKLLRKAVSISCEGHIEMMKSLSPGMFEYQVRSAGEYVFMSKGAEATGYNSICGGGENSTVLHYESVRKQLNAGELILLDMGAEYHGYTADVTRTLPVNGTFSPEQKMIYELVLSARDSAISRCKPGNDFYSPHNAAIEIIKNGLLELGIIEDGEDYKKYFMHATSHYLGLDVHDPGTFSKLKEGNLITVEPGIYIPADSPCNPKWWNIGIRIEDDILINSNGHENLSAACPVKVFDIENLMKKVPEFITPFR